MKKLIIILIASVGFAGCGDNSSVPRSVPPPANVAPTVSASADFAVGKAELVTLEATGFDTDGTITAYAWEQVSGTEVQIADADTATATFTAPTVGVDGAILSFRVTVTDDDGATATDTTDIEVIYAATYRMAIPEMLEMDKPLLFNTTGSNYDAWDPDDILDGTFVGTLQFEWTENIMIGGVLTHKYEHESYVNIDDSPWVNRWSMDFFRDGDTGDLLLLGALGDNECRIDEITLPFNDEPETITVAGREIVEGTVGMMACDDGETNSLLWTWTAQVSDLDDDWLKYTQTFVWDWEDGFHIVVVETRHITVDGGVLEVEKEEAETLDFGGPDEELMWYSYHFSLGVDVDQSLVP